MSLAILPPRRGKHNYLGCGLAEAFMDTSCRLSAVSFQQEQNLANVLGVRRVWREGRAEYSREATMNGRGGGSGR